MNRTGEAVVRSGHFELRQSPTFWGVVYSLSGSYKLHAHDVTITIESGSARIADARPEEVNHLGILQLGICYSVPDTAGEWDVYPPSGPTAVKVSLDNIALKKGATYHFPSTTVKISLPKEALP